MRGTDTSSTVDRAGALAAITQALAEPTDDDATLLPSIVAAASEFFDGLCIVVGRTRDRRAWECVAEFASDPALLRDREQMSREHALAMDPRMLIAGVLESGRPLLIADLQERERLERLPPHLREHVVRYNMRSMSVAPMRSDGVVVGALAITRFGVDPRPLDADDVQLVQLLADHLAQTILIAQLRGDLRAASERWRTLLDIAQTFVVAAHDYDQLQRTIVERTGQLLDGMCILGLLADDGASWKWVAEFVGNRALEADLAEHVVSRETTLETENPSAVAARTGKPVLLPDLQALTDWPGASPEFNSVLKRHNIRASMSVPLRSSGRVIGTLSITPFGPTARALEQADVELLQLVADHAAQAIASARHLDAVRRELLEHRRTRESLEQSEARLRQAAKMEAVGRLAGGVAHDFNNLLTVVLSYCAMALDELELPELVRGALEEIERAGERAAKLTNQLLAFSRQGIAKPRSIDVDRVITGMVPMLRPLLGADVQLRVLLRQHPWPCHADPGQIEQVVMNLAVNARDAMPDGGTITIATANVTCDEAYVATHPEAKAGMFTELSVSDTGSGMEPEVVPKIFEPFFSTKPRGSGTGLGLATVYAIVDQAGGHLRVDSEIGQGTTFKAFLPRTEREAHTTLSEAPASAIARGSETILVAEDDSQVRVLVARVLAQAGYQVLEAHDAEQALALSAQHEGIDLLLSDVVLPGLNGPQLAERLRRDRPTLPVLFMSGYTEDAIARHEIALLHLLPKPLVPETLLRKLREVLD